MMHLQKGTRPSSTNSK